MKIKNNLGQSFKTGGTAMGSTLFFAGVMICYYLSLAGLVLVALGALAALQMKGQWLIPKNVL